MPSDPTPEQALARIFGLDSTPGVVVSRARPEHLADEVLRELRASGYTLVSDAELERLRAALERLVEHRDALANATAHRLTCECSGTDDGEHGVKRRPGSRRGRGMSGLVFGRVVPCRRCDGRGQVKHQADKAAGRERARLRRRGVEVQNPPLNGSMPGLLGQGLRATRPGGSAAVTA